MQRSNTSTCGHCAQAECPGSHGELCWHTTCFTPRVCLEGNVGPTTVIEIEEARREAAAVRRAYLHEKQRAEDAIRGLRVHAPHLASVLESKAYDGEFASTSEPVVWADDAAPFTGTQVQDLLQENERLRGAIEARLLPATDPADEAIVDRLVAAKTGPGKRMAPLSGPELAAKFGFKPHDHDPLTGGVKRDVLGTPVSEASPTLLEEMAAEVERDGPLITSVLAQGEASSDDLRRLDDALTEMGIYLRREQLTAIAKRLPALRRESVSTTKGKDR